LYFLAGERRWIVGHELSKFPVKLRVFEDLDMAPRSVATISLGVPGGKM
jgi:hypothetical protein